VPAVACLVVANQVMRAGEMKCACVCVSVYACVVGVSVSELVIDCLSE